MDQAELAAVRQRFDEEVRGRFPTEAIQRVEVLQYGDAPEIEPGQLLARVVINVPEGEDERGRSFEKFHDQRREAFRELRSALDKLPVPVVLQFVAAGEPTEGEPRGPIFKLAARGLGGEAAGFTPVMARLGAEDLETVDTLITAGIASSRAEAVRWALARIRERPAYEQLRARTREIDELKTQF